LMEYGYRMMLCRSEVRPTGNNPAGRNFHTIICVGQDRWTGITIEANHREALKSALMNGTRYAIAKATPTGIMVDLRNSTLASGVQFVLDSVPDAVAYFGLTAEDIERHLAPKVSAILSDK